MGTTPGTLNHDISQIKKQLKQAIDDLDPDILIDLNHSYNQTYKGDILKRISISLSYEIHDESKVHD